MQWIDQTSWKRKRHFDMFKGMDDPHYYLCADVDITATLAACKERGFSSFVYMIYLISRVANESENLRYRIRGDQVCLHDRVDPAFTVLDDQQLYYHCTVEYQQDVMAFAQLANEKMQYSLRHKTLQDSKGRDDVLFMSCIPWVKFQGISHAMHYSPCDSIPRFYWGKYEKQGEQMKMPFSVQVHHGLADGIHVAQQFEQLQQYLSNPALVFDT